MIAKKPVYVYQVACREFSFAATFSENDETRKSSFLLEQIPKYTVLEIQFQSVNFTLVARVCKNFK